MILLQFGEMPVDLVHEGEKLGGLDRQILPLRREGHAAFSAQGDHHAQLFLDGPQAFGQGGLRDVELGGRPGDIAAFVESLD